MKHLSKALFLIGIVLFQEASASNEWSEDPERRKPSLSRLALYFMERQRDITNEDSGNNTWPYLPQEDLGRATLNALIATWQLGPSTNLCRSCHSQTECFSVRVERILKMNKGRSNISVLLSEEPSMGQKVFAIKSGLWIFPDRMKFHNASMSTLSQQREEIAVVEKIERLTQTPTYIPLPSNVLQNILLHTLEKDLTNFRAVCTSWKAAADDLIERHFAELTSQYDKVDKLILNPGTLSPWQAATLMSRLYVIAPGKTIIEFMEPKVGLRKLGRTENQKTPKAVANEPAYTPESPDILASIPNEVMLLIFRHLPSNSLAVVVFVNRQFAIVAKSLLITLLAPIRERIIREFHNTQSKDKGDRPKDNLIAARIYDAKQAELDQNNNST